MQAEVVAEYVPFADRGRIHGVTYDGTLVWFARDDELVAFDPAGERVVRRIPLPGATAGTTFDGTHLYQVAKTEIVVVDPEDGRVVRRFRAPEGMCSGLAWSGDRLFVGQFREARILEIEPKTGVVMKTIASDRSVTGMSFVDGSLWYAASFDGKPSELRRLDADGTVAETLRVPVEEISGIERTREGDFWCGCEKGTLRRVRAVRRDGE